MERKKLKIKTAGLDEMPIEVWKTRKFDILRLCNAIYKQNTIEKYNFFLFYKAQLSCGTRPEVWRDPVIRGLL